MEHFPKLQATEDSDDITELCNNNITTGAGGYCVKHVNIDLNTGGFIQTKVVPGHLSLRCHLDKLHNSYNHKTILILYYIDMKYALEACCRIDRCLRLLMTYHINAWCL